MVALLGLCWTLGTSADEPEDESQAATVPVQTAPVGASATVARLVVAYGVVEADPTATDVVALPRAAVVAEVRVRPGERVDAGQPLLEVETAAAPRQQYQQAVAALRYAQAEVASVERQFKQQLATRDQLAQARRDLADAEAAERSARATGADVGTVTVRAPHAGIVTRVAIAQGDRPAADTPLAYLARESALVVRVGVVPEAAAQLAEQAAVRLTPLFGDGAPIDTTITAVQGMLDPATGLVEVTVAVPPESAGTLLLGTRMRARIAAEQVSGWLVPRSAVLRDETGDYVYGVVNEHAHRVNVSIVSDRDAQMLVSGDLSAGERIVVSGNYQLVEGAALKEVAPNG